MRHWSAAALAAILLGSPAALADDVSGIARVVDGDTLVIPGSSPGTEQRLRLHGIDAPEHGQTCSRGATTWNCGTEATAHLRSLVEGRPVTCRQTDTDTRHHRIVAVCSTAQTPDINRAMVQAGMARAYRQYSADYIGAEEQARSARAGLWSGPFTDPWNWRRGQRTPDYRPPATPAAARPGRGTCSHHGGVAPGGVCRDGQVPRRRRH